MATADLLLHPVRMRIIQSLLDGRALTTSDIRAYTPDVAPATLYRQVGILAEAGIIEVVDERRIRGAVERTYRLNLVAAQVDGAEVSRMSPDDHRRAFMAFVATLLADFDRYLERETVDPVADMVAFRQAALWLTDAELIELLQEVGAAISARIANPPGAGRVRRVLSTILVPSPEPAAVELPSS